MNDPTGTPIYFAGRGDVVRILMITPLHAKVCIFTIDGLGSSVISIIDLLTEFP